MCAGDLALRRTSIDAPFRAIPLPSAGCFPMQKAVRFSARKWLEPSRFFPRAEPRVSPPENGTPGDSFVRRRIQIDLYSGGWNVSGHLGATSTSAAPRSEEHTSEL